MVERTSVHILLVESVRFALPCSRADLAKNCAFRDKSMKLGTWILDILRSILRNGATSDLTFGDL